jgi:sec-independent protein translocase protein TatA
MTRTVIAALSPLEIGLIVAVVILLFGARKLPEIARSLGESARELRKAAKEVEQATEEPKASGATKSESSNTAGPTGDGSHST